MGAEVNREINARQANEAKLTSLYNEYYNKIAHYAFVRIGSRIEAEDIAGEVFLKALESLGSYKEHGVPMQAWLFKIAHNLVVDYFRKMAKCRTVSIDTVQIEADTDLANLADKNIALERVAGAMAQLTPEQREVLRLRFFGGLTSKETGSILKKKDGAVREMQRAAIQKLRQLLVTDESLG